MSRPLYETRGDIANEERALRAIESRAKKRGVKLPMSYRMDYAMITEQKEITSWIEVKTRKHNKGRYETLAIGLNKLMAGIALEERTKLPFFLIIAWDDFIGYIRISSLEGFKIAMGGRTDRDDDQDQEPMVHIPVEQFKELKVAK